jgi:hypothetical protein
MDVAEGSREVPQVEEVSRRAIAAGYLALPESLDTRDNHRLARQLDPAYAAILRSLNDAGPYYFGRIDANRILACALHARISNQPLSEVDLQSTPVNAYLAFAQLVSYY